MTHDEIKAMDADGLRLAIDTALGYTGPRRTVAYRDRIEQQVYHEGGWVTLPDWPRDIAAAWGLVEEMHEPWCVTVERNASGWICAIYDIRPYHDEEYHALCETAPLAISFAWLMWKQT